MPLSTDSAVTGLVALKVVNYPSHLPHEHSLAAPASGWPPRSTDPPRCCSSAYSPRSTRPTRDPCNNDGAAMSTFRRSLSPPLIPPRHAPRYRPFPPSLAHHGSMPSASGEWWQKCVTTSRTHGLYCQIRTVRSSAEAVARNSRFAAAERDVMGAECMAGRASCQISAWSSREKEL